MSEIGEIIKVATSSHGEENSDCPFCPIEKAMDLETYPGEKNDSDTLGEIMEKPDLLCEKQTKARPKMGGPQQQSKSTEQEKNDPIYTQSKVTIYHLVSGNKSLTDLTKIEIDHSKDPYEMDVGDYSSEAHHLISGNQALKDQPFEQWIDKDKGGKVIEKDTGYSINNADNGLWAPSIPEKHKGGTWGSLKPNEKYFIAKASMQAGHPQFHKGHHNISDKDDPGQIKHETYDGYLKEMLKTMNDRMSGWPAICPLCEEGKKKPLQPSVRANQVLDNLSKVVRRKISAPVSSWEIFISKCALLYHLDGHCSHGSKED